MMTLTPTAVEAVQALVTRMEVDSKTGGLRIAPGESPGTAGLELALVNAPEATDQAIHIDGARVFLEEAAAQQLAGKLLDAHVEDGRVQFVVLQTRAVDPRTDGEPPV